DICTQCRVIRPVFLQRSRPHRALHSFPTRRSSDLYVTRMAAAWSGVGGVTWTSTTSWTRSRRVCTVRASSTVPEHPVRAPTSVRSEEHTSELQSQSNLVCRLLLEKKK